MRLKDSGKFRRKHPLIEFVFVKLLAFNMLRVKNEDIAQWGNTVKLPLSSTSFLLPLNKHSVRREISNKRPTHPHNPHPKIFKHVTNKDKIIGAFS